MTKIEESKSCKVCLAMLFVGILSTLALADQVMEVIEKVHSGHGLDYYTTMRGYQINYIGALVLFILTGFLLLLSPIIYWFSTKDERSFKRKYGIHE